MSIKLSKENKQKVILGCMLFVGLVVSYFMYLVTPTKEAKIAAEAELLKLQPQIKAAKAQIAKVAAMETDAPRSKLLIDQVESMIPQGAPVAWFPPKLEEILKNCGVEKSVISMSAETPDKDLKNYKRINWTVEIPRITFYDFCKTLQTLENKEPLIEIMNVTLEASGTEPEYQKATFNIRNLVRQL